MLPAPLRSYSARGQAARQEIVINRLATALVGLSAVALLATGCGSSEVSPTGQEQDSGVHVKTLAEAEAALRDAGLCTDPHDEDLPGIVRDDPGIVSNDTKVTDAVTSARYCGDTQIHMAELKSVEDRDLAARGLADIGDDSYYAGTGDNKWVMGIGSDQLEAASAALGGQMRATNDVDTEYVARDIAKTDLADPYKKLADGGTCLNPRIDIPRDLNGGGGLPKGSLLMLTSTVSVSCITEYSKEIELYSFAITTDRDAAAAELGQAPEDKVNTHHYVGTGDNKWILYCDDEAHEVVRNALGADSHTRIETPERS